MSQYDNTNSGVIFEPHQDQAFSGQGRINIEGKDMNVVMIFEKISRDKPPVLVLYQRLGPLFPNDRSDNERAPNVSGPMDGFPDHRIAGWKGQKDGRKYMSMKISRKDGGQSGGGYSGGGQNQGQPGGQQQGGSYLRDDEIPF